MAFALVLIIINATCFSYVRDVAGEERSGGVIYAVSQPGVTVINCEEGCGFNKTDKNGYINATSDLADDGYILILGNSMTRGTNVMQEDRYSQQLNRMIAKDYGGDASETAYIYTISRGGALFAELASGYDAAMEEFSGAKAIVIQLVYANRDRMLSQEYLAQVYNQRVFDETQKVSYILEHESKAKTFGHFVKNTFPIIPFAKNRRLNRIDGSFRGAFGFNKFIKLKESNCQDIRGVGYLDVVGDDDEYKYDIQPLVDALEYLNNKNDIPLIILDIPEIASFDEKDLTFNLYQQDDWANACDKAGVTFIGMTDEFQQLYQNEKKLPYGFNNTSMGIGHLNKDGNRVVAETLYKRLKELEVVE